MNLLSKVDTSHCRIKQKQIEMLKSKMKSFQLVSQSVWWLKSAKWTNALIGHFIQSKMWKSVSIMGFIQVIVPARVRKNIVLTHLCGQFRTNLTDANRYVFE